jgi:hypothetical protein
MKKLVSASVMLLSVCAAMIASPSTFAQAADDQATAGGAQSGNCGVTIKDPAEYNAYANATSQSDPHAKAQAIEAFLQQYPNTIAKVDLLSSLMDAYKTFDAAKTLDAAKRLVQADPGNLRALTFIVYLEKQQANGAQAGLDQAAADAQTALNASKPQCMTQADYDKVKDVSTPIFYSAIGADDQAKKDSKSEIDAYTKELQAYKDPAQTTQLPGGLLDTYYLGQAYVQLDPKDPANLKNAVWFLTRAAAFSKPPYQAQIQNAAVYWYKKYHCAQNDAACINGNPPEGFSDIQQLASSPANVFPPSSYNPTPAPPPPSPAELAHTAIASTTGCANATPAPPPAPPAGTAATTAPAPASPAPAASASIPAECTSNLKNLALSDKEFILSNGDQADQQAIWGIMNGVTAEVPGVVVSATADSVQLAVSPDAQQSNKADFTVNMKTSLKTPPTAGTKVTYDATFDSYTQNPPMIILKDGEPKAAPKAPVRHTTTHHASSGM